MSTYKPPIEQSDIDLNTFQQGLDQVKKDPNSAVSNEIIKRIKTGRFDTHLAQLGIERTPTGIKKVGEPGQFQTPIDIGKYRAEEQGLPVALSPNRVEPTTAGKIARAPLNLLGRLAANFRAAGDFAAGKDYMEATDPIYTKLTGEVTPIGVAGEREINQMKAEGITPTVGDQVRTGAKDFVDFLGAGAEAASYTLGGEAVAGVGKAALKTAGKEILEQGAKQTGKELIKQTTKQGLISGTAGGFGTEAQNENATLGSILASTAIGAATGAGAGAAGGAIPGVVGAVKNTGIKVLDKAADLVKIPGKIFGQVRGQKLAPAVDVATRQKVGQELVRQGVDENIVNVIANAGDNNVADFRKMYAATKEATNNPKALERATDVTGKTFTDRLRHIDKVNKEAGAKLDEVATALQGKAVDYTPVLSTLDGELSKVGASKGFASNGTPIIDFTGSDFEGIKPIENAINSVYTRLNSSDLDAQGLHRVKRFIDNQVNYGKETGGLSGQAENILKGLRKNIDELLDQNFPEYKAVNDTYAASKGIIDDTNKLLGNTRALTDELKDAKAGDIMRRLLGNSANRNNIAQLVSSMDNYAKSTGYDDGKDLIEQIVFADALEGIYGTQATTGLQGQVQRALSSGQELMDGNLLKATGKTVGNIANKVIRVNEQRRDAALRAMLGLDPVLEKAKRTVEEKVGIAAGSVGAGVYVTKKATDKK